MHGYSTNIFLYFSFYWVDRWIRYKKKRKERNPEIRNINDYKFYIYSSSLSCISIISGGRLPSAVDHAWNLKPVNMRLNINETNTHIYINLCMICCPPQCLWCACNSSSSLFFFFLGCESCCGDVWSATYAQQHYCMAQHLPCLSLYQQSPHESPTTPSSLNAWLSFGILKALLQIIDDKWADALRFSSLSPLPLVACCHEHHARGHFADKSKNNIHKVMYTCI